VGSNWVVLDGLKEGEQVVVDGFQKMMAPGPGQAGAVDAAASGASRRRAAAAASSAPAAAK
jgi:membrane fusion protein (multidrug efflux system)